ncbi:MAG: GNAT family protein [Chloroflexota bacterium]
MYDGKLVRLRAVEPEDAEHAFRWINDREVTQYLMARYPISLASEKDWATKGSVSNSFEDSRYIIEALADGAPIGVCGLHHVSPENRVGDLGIMIGEKRFWSQGYGTDAMLTLMRLGFYQMNLHKITLGVFEINPRAQAVYTKVGFTLEGRGREEYYQDGRYLDVIRMGVLRREFEARYPPSEVGNMANSIAGA